MVAFIPAHRPEAYALTKKYATMETALLQTFVVHHITSTFPMEQLHGRARLAHKYIHLTISRFQTHFPDLSIHTIHSIAHISRMLRHNYTVVLIQIEHNFFLRTKVISLDEMEKAACFGWLRRKRASANFVILQQMVSPCGLNAVFPQIFRMDTLFHMVTGVSPPNYIYTNEKSLSHCRDQGSS